MVKINHNTFSLGVKPKTKQSLPTCRPAVHQNATEFRHRQTAGVQRPEQRLFAIEA